MTSATAGAAAPDAHSTRGSGPVGFVATSAVSALLGAGIAVSTAFGGTATTSPVPAFQTVRYVGSWTSTSLVLPSAEDSRMRFLSDLLRETVIASPSPPVEAGSRERSSKDDRRIEGVTDEAQLRWLRETSGLTWEQLAKVFGVSRRAVHLWVNGRRMNAGNAELLSALTAVVRDLPGATPEERRAWLLRPDESGRSVIDHFRARHSSDAGDVSGAPIKPGQLLGALHGDVAK